MNIELSFDGVDYYIAELSDITDEMWATDPRGYHWHTDVAEWCTNTFGPSDIWGENPVTGWKQMRNKFYFTKASMRTFFILRWS